MERRQKPGHGVFLCSNVLLVVIACIQSSGMRYHGTLDDMWAYLWLQIQVSAAVSVSSLTAFRPLFTTERSKFKARNIKAWYCSPMRLLRETEKDPWYGGKERILPRIPSPTLSGMRTFIRGGARTTTTLDTTSAGVECSGNSPAARFATNYGYAEVQRGAVSNLSLLDCRTDTVRYTINRLSLLRV